MALLSDTIQHKKEKKGRGRERGEGGEGRGDRGREMEGRGGEGGGGRKREGRGKGEGRERGGENKRDTIYRQQEQDTIKHNMYRAICIESRRLNK